MQSLSRNENRAVLAFLAILVHDITLHNNDERWDAAEPAMHKASGGIATSVWIILEKMIILAVEMIVTAWAIWYRVDDKIVEDSYCDAIWGNDGCHYQ